MPLLNGDLELWTAGNADSWTLNVGAGSTVTQETTIIHGGVSAGKFDSSAGNACSLGQTLTVTAVGTPYTGVAWYRGAVFVRYTLLGGASNGWTMQADGSWAVAFAQFTPTSAGAYAQHAVRSAVVPVGVTGIFFEIGGGTPGTPAYFDDTRLEPDMIQRQQAVPFTRGAGGGGKI